LCKLVAGILTNLYDWFRVKKMFEYNSKDIFSRKLVLH
jgi:hypothetical protein